MSDKEYPTVTNNKNKQFEGIEIIFSPNLPVEILNKKTNEMEIFHMIQKGDTLFVSEELFSALDRRYGRPMERI